MYKPLINVIFYTKCVYVGWYACVYVCVWVCLFVGMLEFAKNIFGKFDMNWLKAWGFTDIKGKYETKETFEKRIDKLNISMI